MRKYFAAAAADQYSQCGTKCFKVEEKEEKRSEMVVEGKDGVSKIYLF